MRKLASGRRKFGTGKLKVEMKVSEIETGAGVEDSLFTFEPDRKWSNA
jgi:outer membrane lipoprotein-sorting protein